MEVTVMDRINMILADPRRSPMTLAQIVSEEIREFKASEQYRIMTEADQYYLNRSDVQKKTNDLKKRSNTKIEHPILKKLVDQKASYLLSKPWTVQTGENDQGYAKALNDVFDQPFRQKIKSLGKGAVKSGIAWLQPYFTDKKLEWARIPSTELIPLWTDSEHTKLDAFIHFFEQTVYVGEAKEKRLRAELWTKKGVWHFKSQDNSLFPLYLDEDYGGDEVTPAHDHFVHKEEGYNWSEVPVVWLKYNEEEMPLYYYIKDLIDDINWQTSVTADVLRDVAKFIYILKNYGGADINEFVNDLQQSLAIKVTGDGGVDKLQADLNIDAVMAFLDKQRRDLYDYAAAVDTKDPDLGNASGTAINFRYLDLDADCTALGLELKEAFRRMKLFIDTYLTAVGEVDYSEIDFDVIFNMDMPVNETDIINNVRTSDGLISRRTMLENHPWVEDVEKELAELDTEKKKAMEEYGEGLFDSELNTGQPQGADDGEK